MFEVQYFSENTESSLYNRVKNTMNLNDQSLYLLLMKIETGLKPFLKDLHHMGLNFYGSASFINKLSTDRRFGKSGFTAIVMKMHLDKKHYRIRHFPGGIKTESIMGREIAASAEATFSNPGIVLLNSQLSLQKHSICFNILKSPGMKLVDLVDDMDSGYTNNFVFSNHGVSLHGAVVLLLDLDHVNVKSFPTISQIESGINSNDLINPYYSEVLEQVA